MRGLLVFDAICVYATKMARKHSHMTVRIYEQCFLHLLEDCYQYDSETLYFATSLHF